MMMITKLVASVKEATDFGLQHKFPVWIFPEFVLPGGGRDVAHNSRQLRLKVDLALNLSPTHRVALVRSDSQPFPPESQALDA